MVRRASIRTLAIELQGERRDPLRMIELLRQLDSALHRTGLRLEHAGARDIVAIESETDAFPSASARRLWDPIALEEQESLARAYLDRVRDVIDRACEALIRDFPDE